MFFFQAIAFYEMKQKYEKSTTLAICCIVSAVCLLLLLAAFAITGELEFLHGRNMFCHFICLMVIFIGLAIYFLRLLKLGSLQCIITGEL
jgi:hypothetical protein